MFWTYLYLVDTPVRYDCMRLREKLSGMQIFSDKKLYVSVVVVVVVVVVVILVAANAAAVVPQCAFFFVADDG